MLGPRNLGELPPSGMIFYFFQYFQILSLFIHREGFKFVWLTLFMLPLIYPEELFVFLLCILNVQNLGCKSRTSSIHVFCFASLHSLWNHGYFWSSSWTGGFLMDRLLIENKISQNESICFWHSALFFGTGRIIKWKRQIKQWI